MKSLFKLIFVIFIATAAAGGYFVYNTVSDLPDIGDVKNVIKNQTTYVYASDGTIITRLFQENRTIVPLKKISPILQKAVISVEDQRFYGHKGIDYIRIVGALIKDIESRGAHQGGSTITQQYVKNAYFSPDKTLDRKVKEAFLATKLESSYTKDEILEKYLNTIYFGNGAYGAEAASQSYFGIPASELNLEQSALLAGLIKAPENYNPHKNKIDATERRNLVINLMAEQGYITAAEANAAKISPLSIIPKKQSYTGIAPYFMEWIKTELEKQGVKQQAIFSQGLKIYTTLDPKIQDSAELAWKKYLPSPKDPEVAIVAVEPKTGAVRAMVGGKDFTKQKFNQATQSVRQPGSSFKPFTLAAAFMEGISPDDSFNASSPRTFDNPGSSPWTVRNYSGESGSGFMSLRKATALSINVIYAEIITTIGAKKVASLAKKLGITSPLNPNPAIALGGLSEGATPLDMAAAYGVFANYGNQNKAYGVERVEMPDGKIVYEHKRVSKQVIDKAVAYLVNDSLRGVIQSGTGTRASIGRPAAGKTGTTTGYVDAWFVGYTPDLSAAVWVGYKDKSESMTNVRGIRVTGGSFPARIWATFMKRALKDVQPSNFENAPKGSLTYVSLCDESNELATEFCTKTSSHVYVRKYKPEKTKECSLHKAIIVPDLISKSKTEAISILTNLKLEYSEVIRPWDSPPDQVIGQEPSAGTQVKEGDVIELTISTHGSSPVDDGQSRGVPDVVGLSLNYAIEILNSNGFAAALEYRMSSEPKDKVIGQRPPAGFLARPGSKVSLVVSGEATEVSVPDVVGMDKAHAKSVLESKGFEVVAYGDSKKRNILRYGPGAVSGQNPKAGTKAKRGSTVAIYVTGL